MSATTLKAPSGQGLHQEFARKFPRFCKKGRGAAWVAMAEKYPPLPLPEPEESDDDAAVIEAILCRTMRKEPDVAEDVEWVYGNLGQVEVAPDAVPNLGAWSLWRWAKENRTQYFEGLWSKASSTHSEGEEGEGYVPDPHIEEIRAQLAVYDWRWGQVTVGPRFFHDALADELEAVRQAYEWATSSEAADDLAVRIERLARVHVSRG